MRSGAVKAVGTGVEAAKKTAKGAGLSGNDCIVTEHIGQLFTGPLAATLA